jgi:hypothetical protein
MLLPRPPPTDNAGRDAPPLNILNRREQRNREGGPIVHAIDFESCKADGVQGRPSVSQFPLLPPVQFRSLGTLIAQGNAKV